LGADEGEDTIEDVLKDSDSTSPENLLAILKLHDELSVALQQIGERERLIIENRYGLTGKYSMTLNEIGEKLGLSRERVRQIEERALLRLRRVTARMGLIDLTRRPEHPNLQPGWNQPKDKTDILGHSIPTKPYIPRKQQKKKK
jgi:DNA-directed RNA polymerase sigma subunit (sigma70/sigma32)